MKRFLTLTAFFIAVSCLAIISTSAYSETCESVVHALNQRLSSGINEQELVLILKTLNSTAHKKASVQIRHQKAGHGRRLEAGQEPVVRCGPEGEEHRRRRSTIGKADCRRNTGARRTWITTEAAGEASVSYFPMTGRAWSRWTITRRLRRRRHVDREETLHPERAEHTLSR